MRGDPQGRPTANPRFSPLEKSDGGKKPVSQLSAGMSVVQTETHLMTRASLQSWGENSETFFQRFRSQAGALQGTFHGPKTEPQDRHRQSRHAQVCQESSGSAVCTGCQCLVVQSGNCCMATGPRWIIKQTDGNLLNWHNRSIDDPRDQGAARVAAGALHLITKVQ